MQTIQPEIPEEKSTGREFLGKKFSVVKFRQTS